MGRDQWSAFYGRYVVKNAVIKAEWVQDAVVNLVPGYLTMEVSRNSMFFGSTVSQILENPMCTEAIALYPNLENSGVMVRTVTQKVDMAKFFDQPDILDNTTSGANFGASSGTDHTVYAHILKVFINGNTPDAIILKVTIDMEVYLTQPLSIIGS